MTRQIIVIEGSDGAGKSTQAKELVNYLNQTNKYGHWEYVHFPDYDTETGEVIKAYLNTNSKNIAGAYSSMMMYIARHYMFKDNVEQNHPYIQKALELISDAQYGNITIARIGKNEPTERYVDMFVKSISILYAVNRMETIETKLKKFPEDTNFVFDRYWGSNILHQATFLKTDSNIAAYSNWLKHLESNILKNWSPSLTLFLDVHEDILLKNIEKRGNGSDFLEQKENVKQVCKHKNWILDCNPEWKVINCSNPFKGELKPINMIRTDIIDEVSKYLKPLENNIRAGYKIIGEIVEETPNLSVIISKIGSFGYAIEQVKEGKRIARKGWNGKNMFVVYQKGYPDGIPCNKNTAEAFGYNEGDLFKCRPYLQMRCADGTHQMWTASQSDILACDWYVVTDEDLKEESKVEEETEFPKPVKYKFKENDRVVNVIEKVVMNCRDIILGDAIMYDYVRDEFVVTNKYSLNKVADKVDE